jgi:hypothetical protein
MNQFSKTPLTILFIVLVVPQVALAAWWNPFSWFGNWGFKLKTDSKTEILEKKIKELESVIQNDNKNIEPDGVGDKKTSNTETTKAQNIKKDESPLSVEVLTKISSSTSKSLVYNTNVDDINKEYLRLQSEYNILLRKVRDKIDSNINYSNRKEPFSLYIESLHSILQSDISEIDKYANLNEKPRDVVLNYLNKIANYNSEFLIQTKNYDLNSIKMGTINYVYDNLYNISSIHVQTEIYKLFFIYDKVFSTKWAQDFNAAITVQQKNEIINAFILEYKLSK